MYTIIVIKQFNNPRLHMTVDRWHSDPIRWITTYVDNNPSKVHTLAIYDDAMNPLLFWSKDFLSKRGLYNEE